MWTAHNRRIEQLDQETRLSSRIVRARLKEGGRGAVELGSRLGSSDLSQPENVTCCEQAVVGQFKIVVTA